MGDDTEDLTVSYLEQLLEEARAGRVLVMIGVAAVRDGMGPDGLAKVQVVLGASLSAMAREQPPEVLERLYAAVLVGAEQVIRGTTEAVQEQIAESRGKIVLS